MNRIAISVLAVTTAVCAAGGVAEANHKKPIEKSYTATAPAPDPTNYAGTGYSVCAQTVPQSFHIEEFSAPEAGTLKAELSGYVGDWDFLLTDDKGRELSNSGLTAFMGEPEKMTYKFKKSGTVNIIACNWAGGPTGNVKYTFTYAK